MPSTSTVTVTASAANKTEQGHKRQLPGGSRSPFVVAPITAQLSPFAALRCAGEAEHLRRLHLVRDFGSRMEFYLPLRGVDSFAAMRSCCEYFKLVGQVLGLWDCLVALELTSPRVATTAVVLKVII